MLRRHLSTADGFVLYTTSVLGLGLIVLPSIAARFAGPWSVLIWLGLALLSYPMGRVLAELGARYPSAGGVTAFIARGGGAWMGELTGALYLAAIAVGAPSTALFFSNYLSKLTPLPEFAPVWIAAAFLGALVAVNWCDVQSTVRLQRWTFYGFLAMVTAGVLLSLSHVSFDRLSDVSGYTAAGILSTPLICFFAFIGWENAAFSGEEFVDPKSLVRAFGASVATVGVLFTALSVAAVGALDRGTIAASNASLADLLRTSLGAIAEKVTAAAALVIIFLMMISWVRGASRLLYSLARSGLFPRSLAVVDPASGSPRRALLGMSCVWALSLTVFSVGGLRVEDYLSLASANFLATYVLIFVAAWRLLRGQGFTFSLIVSSLAIAGLVISGYRDLWYSLVTAALFFLVRWIGLRRRPDTIPEATEHG